MFAFNSSVLDQGLPKGGHYSTRTVNATSEYSQQGWFRGDIQRKSLTARSRRGTAWTNAALPCAPRMRAVSARDRILARGLLWGLEEPLGSEQLETEGEAARQVECDRRRTLC